MKSKHIEVSRCFVPPHTGLSKLNLTIDKRCKFDDLLYNYQIINNILKPLKINQEP
jgi:hypothetical protein